MEKPAEERRQHEVGDLGGLDESMGPSRTRVKLYELRLRLRSFVARSDYSMS